MGIYLLITLASYTPHRAKSRWAVLGSGAFAAAIVTTFPDLLSNVNVDDPSVLQIMRNSPREWSYTQKKRAIWKLPKMKRKKQRQRLKDAQRTEHAGGVDSDGAPPKPSGMTAAAVTLRGCIVSFVAGLLRACVGGIAPLLPLPLIRPMPMSSPKQAPMRWHLASLVALAALAPCHAQPPPCPAGPTADLSCCAGHLQIGSVTEIPGGAWDSYWDPGPLGDCDSLEQVTILDGVTEIGDYAFRDCSSLAQVTIPDSVTEIGWETFYGCSSLAQVTIPESVTWIGYSAFSGCTILWPVTIPGGVAWI
eukprot:COSAG05_NODE_3724_length_1882_cov_1.684801_1_plen_305_part_10